MAVQKTTPINPPQSAQVVEQYDRPIGPEEPVRYKRAWKAVEGERLDFPTGKATMQYEEPIGPVRKKGFIERKWGEVEEGVRTIAKKRGKELGLIESEKKGRGDGTVTLTKAQLQQIIKGRSRPAKRGRQPVPGGRPKRPWIQSRRAMELAEPYDPMDDLISTGEEMLDMGGMADPLAGGYGTSVDDIMDLGAEMMGGFGSPRRSRSKPKPKRKKGKRR